MHRLAQRVFYRDYLHDSFSHDRRKLKFALYISRLHIQVNLVENILIRVHIAEVDIELLIYRLKSIEIDLILFGGLCCYVDGIGSIDKYPRVF